MATCVGIPEQISLAGEHLADLRVCLQIPNLGGKKNGFGNVPVEIVELVGWYTKGIMH